MIVIGIEGAHQEKEEDHLTTTWHLGCPYPMNRYIYRLTRYRNIMTVPPYVAKLGHESLNYVVARQCPGESVLVSSISAVLIPQSCGLLNRS
jgi:hypothetical protein